ncbi:hypothetical protein ADILRU_1405 [Leifsonia rubra CMS 76R]|nr:hypothetical protein ADILRU_1405 [Leifsonia rubra CMS 76R]
MHAFDESGGGYTTVAAMVEYPEDCDPSSEEFENALRDSEAVESLYDLARTVLRTVCATVDSIPQIETEAPRAEYGQLQKANNADEADSGAAQIEESGK